MQRILLLLVLLFPIVLQAQNNTINLGMTDSFVICEDYANIIAFDSVSAKKIRISEFAESLVSDDHTSEGFILKLSDNSLLNIFRLDPGEQGHHVGNNAKLVKRTSTDNGANWTDPITVYNDSLYDDRNVIGGFIGKDSIIVFFRKYEAYAFNVHVGMFYFYSFDGGETWTEPIEFDSGIYHNSAFTTSKLINIPGRGFLLPIYQVYSYVQLRFSHDGFNWDTIAYEWDFRQNFNIKITEISFAYVGDGKIMGLFRNDRVGYGQNYYYVFSDDFGYTWTDLQPTNLAFPYTCPAPLIFYDFDHDDVWVVVTDRRSNMYGHPANEESLWIYKNKVYEVQDNPTNFSLVKVFERPLPSDFRFYGYPAQVKLDRDNYLILFTDCYKKLNGKEGAYLYQFYMSYDSVRLSIDNYTWSNGLFDSQIVVNESGIYEVAMLDSEGDEYIERVNITFIGNPDLPFDNDTVFASTSSFILDAQNYGCHYFWNTGETTKTIMVDADGLYSVTITNECYKSTVDSIFVFFNIVQSAENHVIEKLQTYPNPIKDIFYIEYPENYFEGTISIYSSCGSIISQKIIKANLNEIPFNIEEHPTGIYIVELISNNQIIRERVFKL